MVMLLDDLLDPAEAEGQALPRTDATPTREDLMTTPIATGLRRVAVRVA
jgi:hypothetical protein